MKKIFPQTVTAIFTMLMFTILSCNLVYANENIGKISSKSTSGNQIVTSPDNPDILINDVSKSEGNSGITYFIFTVGLLDVSSQTVTVDYTTVDGTAAAPGDYQAESGTVIFAPGETVKGIFVAVNGDLQPEPNETFTVKLSNAVNGTISVPTATGTILDDDGQGCTYSFSPTSLNVGAGGSSGNVVSVNTQAGCNFTATSNSSFIRIDSVNGGSGSGTVTFSIAANNASARSGTINIAGQIFTINQAAGVSPATTDLRVTITDAPDPLTFGNGQDINYGIVVSNVGNTPATGVVLTDVIPDGLVFVSASTSQGACSFSNKVVTCNLGNVTDSATVIIAARPTAPGVYTNTVSVSANEQDANIADNSASAVTTVNPQPTISSTDLRLVVFQSPGEVTFGNGDSILYAIYVDNDGPSLATGVVLTTALTSGVDFVSATARDGSCSYAAGVVTCNIGNLAVETVIVITVRPNKPGVITNTFNVKGNEVDPISSNNSVTVSLNVLPAPGTVNADLRVNVIEPENPVANTNVNYEIFVTNGGPSLATQVKLADILPANTTFISAATSQGICSFANNIVTCDLGTVTNSVAITLTVRPQTAGTYVNTVSVTGNEVDFNTSNNMATTSTTVMPSPKTRKRMRFF